MAQSMFTDNKENPNDMIFQRNFQDVRHRGTTVPLPTYFFESNSKRISQQTTVDTNQQLFQFHQTPQSLHQTSTQTPSGIYFTGSYADYMGNSSSVSEPKDTRLRRCVDFQATDTSTGGQSSARASTSTVSSSLDQYFQVQQPYTSNTDYTNPYVANHPMNHTSYTKMSRNRR